MTWAIQLPYRTKDASVLEIAECARTLDDECDRRVVRELTMLLVIDHDCGTVEDALALVGKAAPAVRRRLLDTARERAGLPDTADVEATERVEAARHSALARGRDRRPGRYAYTDVGTIIDLNDRDDEIARELARHESRRNEREQLEAERKLEAARQGEVRQAQHDAMLAESPQLRRSR
jgi:hypothetical protein